MKSNQVPIKSNRVTFKSNQVTFKSNQVRFLWVWSPLPHNSNRRKCNVLSYIFAEAHDTTEVDYNIICRIYSHSSILHLSSYYQAYVAKSQGRRRHMGKGQRSQLKVTGSHLKVNGSHLKDTGHIKNNQNHCFFLITRPHLRILTINSFLRKVIAVSGPLGQNNDTVPFSK